MSSNDGRVTIRSGAPWEPLVGYSRAVRVGNIVAVSGSAAVDGDGQLVGEGPIHSGDCLLVRQSEAV